MNITALLDHLSLFENLISLPPQQLINALRPHIVMCVSVGRYFILLMFLIHMTKKLVSMPHEKIAGNVMPDVYKLLIIMVIFGNTLAYNVVINICVSIFNLLSDNICQAQLVQFKGSFRSLIDQISEQSRTGIDFFNVKASNSSVLTMLISASVMLLLITYYVFVSVGMFELLLLLAIGPVVAGFLFLIKTPLERWFNAILACLMFPVITAIAVTIINQSDVIIHIGNDLLIGSFITMLLQMILAICFFDLVILFHSQFFGTRFMNVPVIIKSAILMMFCNVLPVILNGGFILSSRKKG